MGDVARRELGDKECAQLVRRRARLEHLSPKINASVPHCDISCTTAVCDGDAALRTQQRGQGIPVGSNRLAFQHKRCQRQSTALVSLDRTQTFLVTHVFHPLYGRELRLIDQHLAWGDDRVYFPADGGGLRYLPTAWTSLAPPDPFVRTSAGPSHFRIEDRLRLATLIAQQAPAQRPKPRQRRR